jgi:hypothetical protein
MIIVTGAPASGMRSRFVSHSSVSFELLTSAGTSITVRSKFTMLTRYPVTSAA